MIPHCHGRIWADWPISIIIEMFIWNCMKFVNKHGCMAPDVFKSNTCKQSNSALSVTHHLQENQPSTINIKSIWQIHLLNTTSNSRNQINSLRNDAMFMITKLGEYLYLPQHWRKYSCHWRRRCRWSLSAHDVLLWRCIPENKSTKNVVNSIWLRRR